LFIDPLNLEVEFLGLQKIVEDERGKIEELERAVKVLLQNSLPSSSMHSSLSVCALLLHHTYLLYQISMKK